MFEKSLFPNFDQILHLVIGTGLHWIARTRPIFHSCKGQEGPNWKGGRPVAFGFISSNKSLHFSHFRDSKYQIIHCVTLGYEDQKHSVIRTMKFDKAKITLLMRIEGLKSNKSYRLCLSITLTFN